MFLEGSDNLPVGTKTKSCFFPLSNRICISSCLAHIWWDLFVFALLLPHGDFQVKPSIWLYLSWEQVSALCLAALGRNSQQEMDDGIDLNSQVNHFNWTWWTHWFFKSQRRSSQGSLCWTTLSSSITTVDCNKSVNREKYKLFQYHFCQNTESVSLPL